MTIRTFGWSLTTAETALLSWVDRVGADRRTAIVAKAVTLGILLGIAGSILLLLPEIQNQWGEDYRFFVGVADRWLATGAFFQPHQLVGPYEAETAVDTLYPPIALMLFVPFTVLPAALWWAIPLGVIATHIVVARPGVVAWPLLAFLAWIPRDQSIVIWGNTTMWVAAAVALGLRICWPSVAVALKPTLLPFMAIGIRRRSWWIAVLGIALVSLPMLPLWIDYARAVANNVGEWPGLLYSVPDVLFVSIPIVAWMARKTDGIAVGDR